jgi:electron transfer flavoprotein beta subunit
MKILTPIKRVPDTDFKIRAQPDGTGLELDQMPFVVNPFDAIALEEAIRIREGEPPQGPVEVVAVGVGSAQYTEQLRTALALGADRALRVDAPDQLDPWNVACVLRAVVQREQPQLVLMGKQAVDDDSNQAGQFLAAQLGWPQATFASQIEFQNGGARVSRETDAGIEIVHVNLPAILTVDLRLNEPRYASLPSILKAKKKTIDELSLDELDVRVQPRLRVTQFRTESTQRKCVRVADIDELLEQIKDATE